MKIRMVMSWRGHAHGDVIEVDEALGLDLIDADIARLPDVLFEPEPEPVEPVKPVRARRGRGSVGAS